MILGLGVDVVEVARFERAIARHGEDFLMEFLLPSELTHWRPRLLPISAQVFAAKEAFFKALGTGKRGRMSWHDLEICPQGRAGALIRVAGETARVAGMRGLRRTYVSFGATRGVPGLAAAMVLLEG
jgi:holo-[acyl-carrier protein] synthase